MKDATYIFYAGDLSSCMQEAKIATVLKELKLKMKEKGYVSASKGLVFVDVEDEAEETIVGLHSEKLALGFALISIPKGVTVRVRKNLRMCWNCHEAFKLISDIVEMDIIVRDLNRFHHFRDGSCTCRDFWIWKVVISVLGFQRNVQVTDEEWGWILDTAKKKEHCSEIFKFKHPNLISFKWEPPDPGILKLNTYGSLRHDGASSGGIIRDHNGDTRLGYTTKGGTRHVLAQEKIAILQGLRIYV
ncbi:hypothetical protein IFM89_022788 [Coptis chinensis]|uniref:DYW domain-containing protein n=1 Tax=Coptis chinensis TaxID=261450 RepID=A0A835HX92_9MAGN|nr:hypothetical protein IFM89_022788 [Coptis chinensis]